MKISCGIIPFKFEDGEIKFFLGHPGGDRWERSNFWMFLKGGVEENESWSDAAIREFGEETGLKLDITSDKLIPLGTVQQNPEKAVVAFGLYYPDINPARCKSNLADDGITYEIDRFKWMNLDEVCRCTHRSHLVFYDQLDKMTRDNVDNYQG